MSTDNAAPVAPAKGIVITPPGAIAESLKRQVDDALRAVAPDQHGALVGIATDKGVNLVVAHRTDSGWKTAAWVGKDWGGPLVGGVVVQKTW